MAVIDSLKLNDGTILYPKTLTSAIYNDGGTERLDNVLAKSVYAIDEIPSGTPLPRDADTLGGLLPSGYALKDAGVIESGNNANGKYVKFGDGTMICYAKFSGSPNPAVSIQQIVWTFPNAFIDANVSVSGSFFCIQAGVAFRNGILLSNTSSSTKNSCNFTGIDFNQGLFNSWMCDLIVTGRWK